MNRLQEIERRMSSIKTEADTDGANLEALEAEVRSLNAERDALLLAKEQRDRIFQALTTGSSGDGAVYPKPGASRKSYTYADAEYRSAWAKAMLYQPLTETERQAVSDVNSRALGTALTTTAEEFIAASETVTGVNNGGLLIPKSVSDKLLEEIALDSPILAAVFRLSVPGMISYPYKVAADPAKWREEGVPNDDEAIEWATLSFTNKELSKTIRITWKLESMTPDSFITYIINELRVAMIEALSQAVIYGTGALDLTGIVNTDLQTTYAEDDNVIDKIINSVALIPKKQRTGLQIYMSDAIARKIMLWKNTHGDYIIPPINGGGLNTLGTYRVNIDPYLEPDDFIVGNLNRGYILNEVQTVGIVKDVSGRNRINDYTAYGVFGGAVVPGRVVFGTME